MLSIAPGAHRFSPSQNIRVILPASHRIGNVHYRQYAPSCSQSQFAGRRGALSARIVFLLSRMSPSAESLRGIAMIHKGKLPFDPKVFLSKINGGRTVSHYGKNQVVYAQGDPADSVFYIQSGKVKATVVSEQGKEAVVALLGANDFFGEGCLAGQPLRLATVSAMTQCVDDRGGGK